VIDDICSLPADVSPCDAAIARWFHNAAAGECEQFIYGGCAGNANNFQTRETCKAACVTGDMGSHAVSKLSIAPRAGHCKPDEPPYCEPDCGPGQSCEACLTPTGVEHVCLPEGSVC